MELCVNALFQIHLSRSLKFLILLIHIPVLLELNPEVK